MGIYNLGTSGSIYLDLGTMRLEFSSIEERDEYFSGSNISSIRNGMIIFVNSEDSVFVQTWTGIDSPTVYDADMWRLYSIRSATSSFELGGVHTISSGGENVYFTNNLTNISYNPLWEGLGDHSTETGRIVVLPSHRLYQDYNDSYLPNGSVASEGTVDYNVNVLVEGNNFTLLGVEFIFGEALDEVIYYTLSLEGITVMEQKATVNVSEGDSYVLWFSHPLDAKVGESLTGSLSRVDGTKVLVRPTLDDANIPYRIHKLRPFKDILMDIYSIPRMITTEYTSDELIIYDGDNIVIDGIESSIALTLDSGTNAFTIRDEDKSIDSDKAINITLDGMVLTLDHVNDFVLVTKINGYWSYYNHRNGKGARVTSNTSTSDNEKENYAAGYSTGTTTTYCTDNSTWYKCNIDFISQKEINFEWDSTNKRWNYTGDRGEVSVFMTFSGLHNDDGTEDVEWEVRKNGLQLDNPSKLAEIERGDTMSMSLMVPRVEVLEGDYLEVYTKIGSSSTKVYTSKVNWLIR